MNVPKLIIHVAEKVFVEGAYTPSVSLKTIGHAHFVKQIEQGKQTKKELNK